MSDEAVNRESNNNMHGIKWPDSSLNPISCESVQALLVEYLMNELEEELQQGVEEHLDSGCVQCKQQWEYLKTGKRLLLSAIPERELSKGLRDKILARASAVSEPQVAEVSVSRRRPSSNRRVESAAIGLAMLACGAMFAAFIAGPRHKETPNLEMVSNPATKENPAEEDTTQLRNEGADAQLSNAPRLETSRRSIALTAGSVDAVYLSMRGEAIFDFAAMQVHFFGSDFPVPPPGKDYVLWLQYEPEGPMHPAQTLQLSGDGRCKAIVKLAENDCYRVFITLEANGRMPTSPTSEQPLLLLQPN